MSEYWLAPIGYRETLGSKLLRAKPASFLLVHKNLDTEPEPRGLKPSTRLQASVVLQPSALNSQRQTLALRGHAESQCRQAIIDYVVQLCQLCYMHIKVKQLKNIIIYHLNSKCQACTFPVFFLAAGAGSLLRKASGQVLEV